MEKTTLYLPPELQAELRLAARWTGRSRAAVIREAIRDYLDRVDYPPLASLGAGADPALSGADSEDWLKANWHPEADWGIETESARQVP